MRATDIDGVVAALAAIADQAVAEGSPLALFPAIYQRVTEAVRAGIAEGRFDDGPRMDRLDTLFANRYLDAVAGHRAGRAVSRAWRVAFQAGARPDLMALQHILLGMNAHINLDLAVAAAQVAPGAAIAGLEADFMAINDLLKSILDALQGALDEHSPLLDLIDRAGGRVDEALIGFSIVRARQEAWRVAQALAIEGPNGQVKATGLLDRCVSELGRVIADPGPVLRTAIQRVAAAERRDLGGLVAAIRAVPAPSIRAPRAP